MKHHKSLSERAYDDDHFVDTSSSDAVKLPESTEDVAPDD